MRSRCAGGTSDISSVPVLLVRSSDGLREVSEQSAQNLCLSFAKLGGPTNLPIAADSVTMPLRPQRRLFLWFPGTCCLAFCRAEASDGKARRDENQIQKDLSYSAEKKERGDCKSRHGRLHSASERKKIASSTFTARLVPAPASHTWEIRMQSRAKSEDPSSAAYSRYGYAPSPRHFQTRCPLRYYG